MRKFASRKNTGKTDMEALKKCDRVREREKWWFGTKIKPNSLLAPHCWHHLQSCVKYYTVKPHYLFQSSPKGKQEWKRNGKRKDQTNKRQAFLCGYTHSLSISVWKWNVFFSSYSVRDSSWSVSPWHSYRITNLFRPTENRNAYEHLNITASEVSEWVCRWDSISFGVYLGTRVLSLCIFETPTQTHLI